MIEDDISCAWREIIAAVPTAVVELASRQLLKQGERNGLERCFYNCCHRVG